MLKILYAASEKQNAKIALYRFMKAIQNKPYIVKVAAYKNSSPNINIDWTLDCLKDIFGGNQVNLDNENLRIYLEQVKYFDPDLIISDLEYYTSYVANLLGKKLWQCSSSIVNHGFTKRVKNTLGIFKTYSHILHRKDAEIERNTYILDTSDRRLIYSHFCDTENPPDILDTYEWVRPYHSVGKISSMCYHNLVCGLLNPSRKIIPFIKKKEDVVMFCQLKNQQLSKIKFKDLDNEDEYFCNLQNSRFFLCEGHTSFLADAFYNGKKSLVVMNYEDTECLLNGALSERFNLSKVLYTPEYFTEEEDLFVEPKINKNVKYLHEKLEEI